MNNDLENRKRFLLAVGLYALILMLIAGTIIYYTN